MEGASVLACTYMHVCGTHTGEKKKVSFLCLIRNLYSPRSTLQVLSFCTLYKVLTAFLTCMVAKGYFSFRVIKFES